MSVKNEIGSKFIPPEKIGWIIVAESYISDGLIKIYQDQRGLFHSTTNDILRQTNMDILTVIRYLCHALNDQKACLAAMLKD